MLEEAVGVFWALPITLSNTVWYECVIINLRKQEPEGEEAFPAEEIVSLHMMPWSGVGICLEPLKWRKSYSQVSGLSPSTEQGGGHFSEEVGNIDIVSGGSLEAKSKNSLPEGDGFPPCSTAGVFQIAVGALGSGDRMCDSGGYKNSPICFISYSPQFPTHLSLCRVYDHVWWQLLPTRHRL